MHSIPLRKLVIVILLVVCSIVSLLLLKQSYRESRPFPNLRTADSLIASVCHDFGMNRSSCRIETIFTHPGFKRKIWHIALPVNLSQTFFHYDLAQKAAPYHIETPAQVDLRENTMNIQLYYRGTVIRTLALRNDTNIVRHNLAVSVILFFNHHPDKQIIHLIHSMGEPIKVAFKTDDVINTASWLRVPGMEDFDVAYWIDQRPSDDGSMDKWYIGEQIRNLKKMVRNPEILVGPDAGNHRRKLWIGICERRGLRLMDASDAFWISGNTPVGSTTTILRRFCKQAALDRHPVLVMEADRQNIRQLKMTILNERKQGLVVVSPVQNLE